MKTKDLSEISTFEDWRISEEIVVLRVKTLMSIWMVRLQLITSSDVDRTCRRGMVFVRVKKSMAELWGHWTIYLDH